MRIAALTWRVREIGSEQEFWDHLDAMLDRAVDCDLVVLPELFMLELAHLWPGEGTRIIDALEPYSDDFESRIAKQAKQRSQTIVAGSHLRRGQNVSYVVSPSGQAWRQPKNILTQWECVNWGLEGDNRIVRANDSILGVTICYDCEFPQSGRVLAETGVLIQAVPAYTSDVFGFNRVRWSCHARALEHQIFVVHASLVGSMGREPVGAAYGSSAIISPSCAPFPPSAILAETPLNEESAAIADVDLTLLKVARETGDVRNWSDRDSSSWILVEG